MANSNILELSSEQSTTNMLSDRSNKYESMSASSKWHDKEKEDSAYFTDIPSRIKLNLKCFIKHGIFSASYLSAAGFEYTGDGDTAECKECGLERSKWTRDMNPFDIHLKEKPDCPFIQRTITYSLSNKLALYSTTTVIRNTLKSNEHKNPSKNQKIETFESKSLSDTLLETDLIQQARRRSFSHWPHRTIPSSAQIIQAGFFNCNAGDRVICIYCNLICQQWTPQTDDPCEVHKILSPNCTYVKAKLIRPSDSSFSIVNESSSGFTSSNHSPTSNNLAPLRLNEIVFTVACNPSYAELPKRHATFATWPPENLPSVDDLVRAGFFYTGTKTIVTCFYCNGSLQNWGPNDNPMIEHARWFPHCTYAKQLCGDELYRKIQESKRAHRESARVNEAKGGDTTTNNGRLLIPDERTLSRLVAARLDLPISQRLLNQSFKLSIIERCWEDQLRLKQDDFACECDLYMACLILQKQIEYINGKKENIVIPSIKMKQIREQNEASSSASFFRPSRSAICDGSTSNEQRNSFMCQAFDTAASESSLNISFESNLIQQVRKRTFSHRPHETVPSNAQMIEAGFFNCNTDDRVICIYCFLICHKWTPHVDDPCEVHRKLSPNCPYVKLLFIRHGSRHIISNNNSSTRATAVHRSFASNTMNSFQATEFVSPAAQNNNFDAIQNDLPSSNPWASIDDYVQNNYFNTDAKINVTCPSCNGAFRNLDSNENSMVDHARRFPHCAYVKQLQGIGIYRKILGANRAQQDIGQLLKLNENTLLRLVAARSTLPMSHTLLNRNYSLSIIKQCWEDQLRLKGEDFVSDLDLEMACLIRQENNDYIGSENENIIIPNESMKQLRELETKAQAEELARIREARGFISRNTIPLSSINVSYSIDAETRTSSKSCANLTSKSTTNENHNETTTITIKSTADDTKMEPQLNNPCVLCLAEERRLACIPCGHLATCVTCGHSLRNCPICRCEIEAFIRIYL